MEQHVLNPCPNCGKRFDFPLTGCMTFVAESLIANSEGKCPGCGTVVVVDQPPPESVPFDALSAAKWMSEKLAVPIVNLPLSVRCRLHIHKMNVETLGELLQLPIKTVQNRFSDDRVSFEQIQTMLEENGLEWTTP